MEKEVALKFQNSKIQISQTSVKTTAPVGEVFDTKYIVTFGDFDQEKYLSIILERYDLEQLIKAIQYILEKSDSYAFQRPRTPQHSTNAEIRLL